MFKTSTFTNVFISKLKRIDITNKKLLESTTALQLTRFIWCPDPQHALSKNLILLFIQQLTKLHFLLAKQIRFSD